MELRTIVFSRTPKAEPTEAEKLAKLAEQDIVLREEVTRVTTVRSQWRFRT